MSPVKISPEISCLPASAPPLSADVGIIAAGNITWIFDVGSSGEALELVDGIKGEKRIVISHFHADHAENLSRIKISDGCKIYGGGFTRKKFGLKGIEVTEVNKDLYFDGGIHLFPVPSSHAKGCVGLEHGDYAFLGDGTYCSVKDGKAVYNAGQLQGLIKTLRELKADRLLLSHKEPLECGREEQISMLEEIYSLREINQPYIYLRN